MISTYLNGRLGNNLFQYSFCRIAALKNECNFYIPSNIEEATSLYSYCSQKLRVYLQMPEPTNPHYWTGEEIFDITFGTNDWEVNKLFLDDLNIDSVRNGNFLHGFYQSESYLLDYRGIIKNDWLSFKADLINKNKNLLQKYNTEDYCFIHFRGTDYKTIPQFFLPLSYYESAINYLTSRKSSLKFVVITDDYQEAKNYFPNFEILSNSQSTDFYLLSHAKYRIIPNSSFSWWAAWLSDDSSITLAPNKWFNYNSSDERFSPDNKSQFFIYI